MVAVTITIPGYDRIREIGSGGFSRVYEAHEKEFNRRVAIKILNVDESRAFDRVAFEDECRSMGSVSEHPNIVTVYAGGFTNEGAPYIAMERYHETLLDRVRASGYLPVGDALDLGVKMAGALHRAHEVGLLHRDVKPQNIFYSNYGEPVLGDFGIAAFADRRNGDSRPGFTPSYAPPEVIDDRDPTVESDLYSLGATLYTALAGSRPFSRVNGEASGELYERIRTQQPPEITSQHLPESVSRVVLGLMVKHPKDRPRQALDVGGLLRECQVQLGLPATPLLVPTTQPGDLDSTITVTRPRQHSAGDSRPAQQVEPDDQTGVTVVAPSRVDEIDDKSSDEENPRRGLVALIGLTALVMMATVGIWLAASRPTEKAVVSDSALAVDSTTTVVVVDDSPLEAPSQLIVAAESDAVEIFWLDVEGAVSYRVEYLSEDRPDDLVDEPPLRLLVEDVRLPICVQVRAVGENGRLSPFSSQSCSSGR